ncbi:class I SAM-dependent DNA methyltransferase [Patescibacteria group bacterium]
MENTKINKIIDDTESFYKNNQESFSQTRQGPWPGWKKLIEIANKRFENNNTIRILDLGCGNGRFYPYSKESFAPNNVEYLGLDNNDYMLVEALLKYQDANFKNFDIYRNLDKIEQKFDLVVGFGITHHIPGKEYRLEWFDKVAKLLTKTGLLCLTFWNLQSDSRFEKTENAHDLEENDYYYGWKDTKTKRYVHQYSSEEITELSKVFKNKNLELIATYDSDGKNEIMNTYIVLTNSS